MIASGASARQRKTDERRRHCINYRNQTLKLLLSDNGELSARICIRRWTFTDFIPAHGNVFTIGLCWRPPETTGSSKRELKSYYEHVGRIRQRSPTWSFTYRRHVLRASLYRADIISGASRRCRIKKSLRLCAAVRGRRPKRHRIH